MKLEPATYRGWWLRLGNWLEVKCTSMHLHMGAHAIKIFNC